MLTSAKKVLELTCFVMAFVLIDIDFQAFKKLKTYINMYRYFQYLLQFPGLKAEKEKVSEVPVMLRTKIWLGLANEDDAWHRMQTEGELAVYAETVSTSCLLSSTK